MAFNVEVNNNAPSTSLAAFVSLVQTNIPKRVVDGAGTWLLTTMVVTVVASKDCIEFRYGPIAGITSWKRCYFNKPMIGTHDYASIIKWENYLWPDLASTDNQLYPLMNAWNSTLVIQFGFATQSGSYSVMFDANVGWAVDVALRATNVYEITPGIKPFIHRAAYQFTDKVANIANGVGSDLNATNITPTHPVESPGDVGTFRASAEAGLNAIASGMVDGVSGKGVATSMAELKEEMSAIRAALEDIHLAVVAGLGVAAGNVPLSEAVQSCSSNLSTVGSDIATAVTDSLKATGGESVGDRLISLSNQTGAVVTATEDGFYMLTSEAGGIKTATETLSDTFEELPANMGAELDTILDAKVKAPLEGIDTSVFGLGEVFEELPAGIAAEIALPLEENVKDPMQAFSDAVGDAFAAHQVDVALGLGDVATATTGVKTTLEDTNATALPAISTAVTEVTTAVGDHAVATGNTFQEALDANVKTPFDELAEAHSTHLTALTTEVVNNYTALGNKLEAQPAALADALAPVLDDNVGTKITSAGDGVESAVAAGAADGEAAIAALILAVGAEALTVANSVAAGATTTEEAIATASAKLVDPADGKNIAEKLDGLDLDIDLSEVSDAIEVIGEKLTDEDGYGLADVAADMAVAGAGLAAIAAAVGETTVAVATGAETVAAGAAAAGALTAAESTALVPWIGGLATTAGLALPAAGLPATVAGVATIGAGWTIYQAFTFMTEVIETLNQLKDLLTDPTVKLDEATKTKFQNIADCICTGLKKDGVAFLEGIRNGVGDPDADLDGPEPDTIRAYLKQLAANSEAMYLSNVDGSVRIPLSQLVLEQIGLLVWTQGDSNFLRPGE